MRKPGVRDTGFFLALREVSGEGSDGPCCPGNFVGVGGSLSECGV